MTGSVALVALAGLVEVRAPLLTAATPHVTPASAPANPGCAPSQLELTGTYTECASIVKAEHCPTSFNETKVIWLHGTKHHDFFLYIEINGGYHGPGMYTLRAWPHADLGQNDGIAKVAIREHASGRFFESAAGFLTVDYGGIDGSLSTGLVENPVSHQGGAVAVKLDLNLAGVWSCA